MCCAVAAGTLVFFKFSSAAGDLAVNLVDGSRLLVLRNGSVISTVAEMKMNDALWHQLAVEFADGNISIAFRHNSSSAETLFSVVLAADDLSMDVYFGSVAEDVGHYDDGFVGCMRDIRVNSDWLTPSWLVANGNASANVSAGCDWSSNCKLHPCNRRGICTDLWTHFTCDCRSPYWGLTCIRGL